MRTLVSNWNTVASRFLVREEGQDLIEYVLVASVLSLTLIAALGGVSTALSTQFSAIAASV